MAKKVLIVDDEQMIRDLVKVSLQGEDYALLEAKDGVEALRLAREHVPDLMILDVMMPGKIGYQVSSDLKLDPDTQGIKIIILTARDSNFIKDAASMAGAEAVVIKPFNPSELRFLVRKVLG